MIVGENPKRRQGVSPCRQKIIAGIFAAKRAQWVCILGRIVFAGQKNLLLIQ
jgi:hypothetical protein